MEKSSVLIKLYKIQKKIVLGFKLSHIACPKSLDSFPSKPKEGLQVCMANVPYSFSWFLLSLSSEYVQALAFPLVTLLRVSARRVPYFGNGCL